MMGNKFLVGAIVLSSLSLSAQDQFGGQLHGNFQLDGQCGTKFSILQLDYLLFTLDTLVRMYSIS